MNEWKIEYTKVPCNSIEENRFISIEDFEFCMKCHGEVEFEWKKKDYSITHVENNISIAECNKQETERLYSTVEELLDYEIDGEPLRKIVTRLIVWDRTI